MKHSGGRIRAVTLVAAALVAAAGCLEAGEFEPFPCNVSSECLGNLVCVEGMCETTLPNGDFGNICVQASECGDPYSTCVRRTYTSHGVCTKTCGNKWDCPKGARCVALFDRTYCMPACERSSHCDTLFFCMFRLDIAGGSYCYPLGPADGAGLLESCESAYCREDLVCLVDVDFTGLPHCKHLCHPEQFWQAPASTCSFRGTHGRCDWEVSDPDTPSLDAISSSCSPLCDTKTAREACVAAGWRCWPPTSEEQVCWPPGRTE